jgi:hypothetical protein
MATLLTLFIIPTFYLVVERRAEKRLAAAAAVQNARGEASFPAP